MSNRVKLVIAIAVLVILAYAFFAFDVPYRKASDDSLVASSTADASAAIGTTTADLIFIESPAAGAAVSSPVAISGQARGMWYFEATFPIEILGVDGTSLGSGAARARGPWMTTDFVPFSATLTFDPGANRSGIIRLKKDNPSGDPTKDDHLDIPVLFSVKK